MDDISVSYNISPRVDDNTDALLGLLSRTWGSLEYQIIQMLGQFLSVSEEEARAVFSHMNMRPRLEVAATLAPSRLIYQKDVTAFREHKRALEAAQETRNLLTHGLWGKTEKDEWVVLQIWGGKAGAQRIDPKVHPMDVETLDKRVASVIAAVVDFMNWRLTKPPLMPSPYSAE